MSRVNHNLRRFPAEWEEQDGVLLAWPHQETDWQPVLDRVEPVFAEIIATISRFEQVILIAPEKSNAKKLLVDANADLNRIRFAALPVNDTWARDFGPITVMESGSPLLLDFRFNGWGGKFPAELDTMINRQLADIGLLSAEMISLEMILEGGSVESDGNGTLLTTGQCLLNRNRNPELDKAAIEEILAKELGIARFLWLEHGYLAGDDTDSHIDTLARLCPDDTILYVACDNPLDEHFKELSAMKAELESFRTAEGKPFRLLPLPLPSASYGMEGERIPATYANFLIINGAVLVPTYGDPEDEAALAAVGQAFPDREIIGINCLPVVLQHGSLHCLTMQLPKGTIQ